MNYEIETIGNEGNKVIVIDDLYPDPFGLIEMAAKMAPFPDHSKISYYPGLRRNFTSQDFAALNYVNSLLSHLAKPIFEAYGYREVRATSGGFSLVTYRPEDLTAIQKNPHFDFNEPNKFAILQYLSPNDNSGTSFYRHKSTGFEFISEERVEHFIETIDHEVNKSAPRTGYINSSNELFERVASFEGKFNRILIYQGAVLHSGNISANANFSPDPKIGRLTANLFAEAR